MTAVWPQGDVVDVEQDLVGALLVPDVGDPELDSEMCAQQEQGEPELVAVERSVGSPITTAVNPR